MDCWSLGPSNGSGSEKELTNDACFVNRTPSSAVWALSGSLWLITLVFSALAVKVVKRNKPLQTEQERRVLLLVGATSLCLCLLGYLKSPSPWTNPVGRDPLISTLFSLGSLGMLSFIAYSPLNPAGSGIALFALQRQRRLNWLYRRIYPGIIFLSCMAGSLPLLALIDPARLIEVFTPLMACLFGLVIGTSTSIQLYTVAQVRKDFVRALREKQHEVNEHQKRGIKRIVANTFRLDLAIATCLLLVLLVCLLVTASVEQVLVLCWVLFPAIHLCGWLFMTRYVVVSRETSLKLNNRRSRHFINHWQLVVNKAVARKNSVPTFSTSTSVNQFQQQQQNNNNNMPAEEPLVPLPSSPSSSSSNSSARSKKSKKKHLSAVKVPSKRWLTRVEEAENEGTIVSKFDSYLPAMTSTNQGFLMPGLAVNKNASEEST